MMLLKNKNDRRMKTACVWGHQQTQLYYIFKNAGPVQALKLSTTSMCSTCIILSNVFDCYVESLLDSLLDSVVGWMTQCMASVGAIHHMLVFIKFIEFCVMSYCYFFLRFCWKFFSLSTGNPGKSTENSLLFSCRHQPCLSAFRE